MKGIKVKAITIGIVAVILVISLALAACAPAAPGKAPVLRLMCGTAGVTSGHYPSSVAFAKIINENVPEVNISLVETGGTHACTGRTSSDLDMYAQTSYGGPLSRYNGVIKYEGKPYRELRVLVIYTIGPIFSTVRADSGVMTFSDLEGRKFTPGPPGSSAQAATVHLLELLGVKWGDVTASYADAVIMTKENRVVGFGKYGGRLGLDSTQLDVKSVTPIRILSLTDEELAKVEGKLMPGYSIKTFPTGSIFGYEEGPPVTIHCGMPSAGLTTKIPQEIGYKMAKALYENWQEVVAAYPGAWPTADQMVKDTMTGAVQGAGAELEPVPLHAGVVQYWKEIGKTIPAVLIGPEYKG